METLLVVGLIGAVVVALVLVLARGRASRARRREEAEEARLASERLAMGRLAWLTGRASEAPEVVPPAPLPGPMAPYAITAAPEVAWVASPRRRLWRDTSAVLLVAAIAVLVIGVVLPSATPTDGGVLGATATPAPDLARTPEPAVTAEAVADADRCPHCVTHARSDRDADRCPHCVTHARSDRDTDALPRRQRRASPLPRRPAQRPARPRAQPRVPPRLPWS